VASIRQKGGFYYVRWTDASNKKREKRAGATRRNAEQMASQIQLEVDQERSGLIDPKATAFRDHERTPLPNHLDTWRVFLIKKGATAKHADLCHQRAAWLVDTARMTRLSHLTCERVVAALSTLKANDRSLRTIFHYRRVIKGFSRWCFDTDRTREDNMRKLPEAVDPETERRHERRALTDSEAARLIATAERGRVFYRTSSVDRAWLYRLALATGYRYSELASVSPAQFELDGNAPSLPVKPKASKRRKLDCQPIPTGLVGTLRAYLATKDPNERIWSVKVEHAAEMIRHDLESAGIPYENGSGHCVDFHSLRVTYITNLVRSGASVKTCQELARHSTPTLTIGVYAKATLHDKQGAVDSLAVPAPEAESTVKQADSRIA
jgi:integrase